MSFSLALTLSGGVQIYKGLGDTRRVDAVPINGFTMNATDLTSNSPTSFSPLSITKPVDAASPLLLQALAADQRVVTVTLSSYASDVSYLFQDANLLSVSHALVAGSLAETISLSFHSLSVSAKSNGKSNNALIIVGKAGSPVAAASSSGAPAIAPSSSPAPSSIIIPHSSAMMATNTGFTTVTNTDGVKQVAGPRSSTTTGPVVPSTSVTKISSQTPRPGTQKSKSNSTSAVSSRK